MGLVCRFDLVRVGVALVPLLIVCPPARGQGQATAPAPPVLGTPSSEGRSEQRSAPVDQSAAARDAMVRTQIAARDVTDPRVLAAMRKVRRHEFVPPALFASAYADRPLPIGWQQTISQPYIVALMTELAAPRPGARVLEVGTGSGYQAAVLAELGADVHTIEIVAPLAKQAAQTLVQLGYKSIKTRVGDGYRGWPEAAPFDIVIVTAAPGHIPKPLKEQLKVGGRLVIPVGESSDDQELRVITRTARGYTERTIIPVRFVPMTGEAKDGAGGGAGGGRHDENGKGRGVGPGKR